MNPVLLEVWRGNVLESVHRGRYAVAQGRDIVAKGGDVDEVTFLRSCAKPFQAVSVLESGARERYKLTDDELALVCGSHHGEDVHVRTAASILRKAGLRPSHLQCGAHMPFSAAAAKALMRAGRAPNVLHNNCSGKHAGMVAAARAMRAPLRNYLDPAHPLQRSNRRSVARFAGVPERSVRVAIDGCSAPTYGLPLSSMARAFARLADPFIADHEFDVTVAMFTHPHMIGHPCEELMRAVPRELVGKVGAEGVYGAGVVGHGLGIAVKIDDGASRPLLAVVVALLMKHAPFNAAKQDALAKTVKADVKNHAGRVVGRYVARV